MRRLPTAALLLLVVLLGFGARAVFVRQVFRGDTVVFPLGDAYYHMRRAQWTLEHWPHLLRFDPLVNYPDGAWIPWPPLHTYLIAGVARLAGGSHRALELAGAWVPPATGALLALPVFLAGALLAGAGVGLGAAAIVAVLPMSIAYSDVGNADHHATVTFFGALWLAGALALLRTDLAPRGARAGAHLLVVLGRMGVLLTWPGSLLYLALADGGVVGVGALHGRDALLGRYAVGLALAGIATALVVPALGPPVGGPFSTLALSWLHVAALAALCFVAAGAAALERRAPPTRGLWERALRLAGLAALAAAVLLALPGLLATLREAAGFLGKSDPWAFRNAEQRPLWSGRRPWVRPLDLYGGFAGAIPLVPLVALWRARERARRDAWLVFALWSAVFGALATGQLRYGSDYAPAFAVGTAVALQTLYRALAARPRVPATAAAGATALVALLGAGPMLAQSALQLREELRPHVRTADPLLATPDGTLYRFAETIARVTPESGGFADPSERPAYGILCPANVGHLIHYVAHRATPSDNFGPYAGSRHFRQAQHFFELRSEARAVEVARALDARYVLTVDYGPVGLDTLAERLHREDGRARPDAPRWEHFRLVAEGPRGGIPLSAFYGGVGTPGVAPYKLFERVRGAVLAVAATPGTPVEAAVTVVSPLGRHFRYEAEATAGPDGQARLRVPYATETTTPVRPSGPWQVRVAGRTVLVAVSEDDVRSGRTIAVARPAGAPG
jgi:asparagine N-glycosylation enzyme membrane subunit Stt3